MKLYELTQNYMVLMEMLEESETDALKDTLESIEEEINSKAENIAKLVKNLESDAAAIKEEEKRLADRRKAIENKVTYLKTYLHEQLELTGLKKVKTPVFTVGIQNNPPSVEIADESLVPSDYRIPQPDKIDKKTILKFLKEGQEVEWASIKQSQSLRIR